MGRHASWALTETQQKWVVTNAANKSTMQMATEMNISRQFLYRWMWDRGIEPLVIYRTKRKKEKVMPGYFNIEEFAEHYKR